MDGCFVFCHDVNRHRSGNGFKSITIDLTSNVAGTRTTKIYAGIWTAVLIATLAILQIYVLQFGWWHMAIYAGAFVVLPLLFVLTKLGKATATKDYAQLSSNTKLIMFTGILSMIFFRFYF